MISIAEQLGLASQSLPGTSRQIPFAILLGVAPPLARPEHAPVRTHRLHVNAAKLPDLPKVMGGPPAVRLAHEQREQICLLLVKHGGAMQRKDIAAATGIRPDRVNVRLSELKSMGVVRLEHHGRTALWEMVDPAEEETE